MLVDPKSRSGGPSESMEAFLHLFWHGAHDEGEGVYRERGAGLPIADSVSGGQFTIYVCSPKCLRKLFRDWVSQLEVAMRAAKPLQPVRAASPNNSLQRTRPKAPRR